MTVSLNSSDVLLTKRLQLGMLPIDALQRDDAPFPITIEVESPANVKLNRHPSGRISLSYRPGLADQLTVRIFDLYRRYIPRRLSIPLLSLAEIVDIEQNQTQDYLRSRVRYPVLFAGANYPINGRTTGLRGRVVMNDSAVSWALIEMTSPTNPSQVIARARGDDRGEFLLVIPPAAVPAITLSDTVNFNLQVYARPTPLLPTSGAEDDPLWDLPIEQVVAPEPTDPVSSGETIPTEYVASQDIVSVNFQLTNMLSSHEVSDIVFNPP